MAQPTASFLDLPPEIRLEIYNYLLVAPETTVSKTDPNRTKPLHPAILRLCRRVHVEALPILYSANAFLFHPATGTAVLAVRPWLGRVRSVHHLSYVRRFRVSLRLDADPGFDDATAAEIFSGCESLVVTTWRAAYFGNGYAPLRRFEAVRGVREVKIWGPVRGFRAYVTWLEKAMKSEIGSEVEPFQPAERPKAPEAPRPWPALTALPVVVEL